MGKVSKFSFPIPGRKFRESEENLSLQAVSINTSKAQRILGTDRDLYIDSPGSLRNNDEPPWKYAGSQSSYMSICVTETTDSAHSAQGARGNRGPPLGSESSSPLNVRPSSTLLGRRYGDDGLAQTVGSGQLRNEHSSSTLRSFYDRQKSPLSISQQTSNSSARDMALRKGLAKITPSRPLVKVDNFVETHGDMFDRNHIGQRPKTSSSTLTKDSRRKPGRLDFSLLVPKSLRHGDRSESENSSPSSLVPSTPRNVGLLHPDSTRRKLIKMRSKDSVASANKAIEPQQPRVLRATDSANSLSQLYDQYATLPGRPPQAPPSPKLRGAEGMTQKRPGQASHHHPHNALRSDEPAGGFAQASRPVENHHRLNVERLRPDDVSSNRSVSSRNTKSSKRTCAGAISRADLSEKSVLSLSSDSEEEEFDRPMPMPKPSSHYSSSQKSLRTVEEESRNYQEGTITSRQDTPPSSRRGVPREAPVLKIPDFPTSKRMSGPWFPEPPSHTSINKRMSRSSVSGHRVSMGNPERISVRTSSSVTSIRIGREGSLQPTPPLSPTSMEFRQSSEFSSRFMAVSKQEEALLAALRHKKARMREQIIEEHETIKSSPPYAPSSRHTSIATSVADSILPGSGDSSSKQRVLFYLDSPPAVSTPHASIPTHTTTTPTTPKLIERAEPSPDLSDFLTFGSDEDDDNESTPRNSWYAGRKGHGPGEAMHAPRSPLLLDSHLQFPDTPSTLGPRISAVGPPPTSAAGFFDDVLVATEEEVVGAKKMLGVGKGVQDRNGHGKAGVRFVDDVNVLAQQMLLDDDEGMWRVR